MIAKSMLAAAVILASSTISDFACGTTLVLSDGVGRFELPYGNKETVSAIEIDEHVGGGEERSETRAWEPEPGFVLLSYAVQRNPHHNFGDHSLSVEKRAGGSTTEDVTKYKLLLDESIKVAREINDDKARAEVDHSISLIRDSYDRHYTKNSRIEAHWRIKSSKGLLGVKTANVGATITATVIRVPTLNELNGLHLFVKNATKSGRVLKIETIQ